MESWASYHCFTNDLLRSRVNQRRWKRRIALETQYKLLAVLFYSIQFTSWGNRYWFDVIAAWTCCMELLFWKISDVEISFEIFLFNAIWSYFFDQKLNEENGWTHPILLFLQNAFCFCLTIFQAERYTTKNLAKSNSRSGLNIFFKDEMLLFLLNLTDNGSDYSQI